MLLEAIDWGPDTINFLLGWVPERYRANVESGLALMAALSVFLGTARPVLARFAPKLSGSAPVVLLDRVLNVFAGNSKRLEARAAVKERLSGIPRQPTIRPPRGEP
jgi:hypothetical protein